MAVVLLSFPNVKQCMLVDQVTTGKYNNQQQEKNLFDHSFVRLFVLSTIFISFRTTMTLRKYSNGIFHTQKQNHFQLNAVFYDEQRFLCQFHLNVVTLIDAIYINERCTMLSMNSSPSVHSEGERVTSRRRQMFV